MSNGQAGHLSHPSKSGLPQFEEEHDPARMASPLPTGGGYRKKGTDVRAWLLVDVTGQAQVIEAGKHAIMRRTGLPVRYLRILDPHLSYPSTMLGRERAIVINLEHIKAIITAQEVLLLNFREPSVTPFVEELQRRLMRHYNATTAQGENDDGSKGKSLYEVEQLQSRACSSQTFSEEFSKFKDHQDESPKVKGHVDVESQDRSKVLPFEFVALEACLEVACSCLESDARALEQEANLALDKLNAMISSLTLGRFGQIKSHLAEITGRVQKVRDEVERLLDDDEDMAKMYLTEKTLVQKHLENACASCMNQTDDIVDEGSHSDIVDRMPAEISSLEANGCSTSYEGASTIRTAVDNNLDVKELEMLLEPYFVQVNGTLKKLSTLREYVDDSKDYINLMMDDKQNQLLQMGVMLTTATLVLCCFTVVADVLGMHIRIELFNDQMTGMKNFLWIVGGGTAGMIFLYVFAIAWYKRKRFL
ncbi:magnesium transporter MRS2-3-like [Corylus avellana]|uniref:magnesium transporter MRS2-3-like n=1 Tax=Corylus avellana TaxID=13451 RepID=UPI00286B1741|nr:magnesium transporter MRS2-3-like [Corylus avellana]